MTKADITTVTPESNASAPPGGQGTHVRTTAPIRRTDRTASRWVIQRTIGAATGEARHSTRNLGYLFVNTSSLATIGRMGRAPVSRVSKRAVIHADLGRQEVSVSAAALGRARRSCEQRRHR